MQQVATLYVFILFFSCSQAPCKQLPVNFRSYVVANRAIQNATFQLEEEINTDKSSWIRSAEYFSCNGKDGYLLIATDRRTYVHSGVPYKLWKNFQAANSLSNFYNSDIKGKFQLNLQS